MSKQRRTSDRSKIEKWLSKNYEFRYNLVQNMPYYKPKDETEFKPVTDRIFNNIYRHLQIDSDLSVSVSELKIILNSDYVKDVHPVREYLTKLPTLKVKTPTDATELRKLARTLTLEQTYEKRKVEDVFEGFLINWFVASVAQAMNDLHCQNQMCLVLLGEEGVKKTTWLTKLFPPTLADYCKTSKIDLSKIDIWLDLGRMFIYNIDDQLKNLQRRDSETMKTIITQPHDYKRLPHATMNTFIPRLANFCGSINGREFLSDVGRNRRYFPFTVVAIDYKLLDSIDINTCWAEAFALYSTGLKYWYEPQELEQFDTNNYRIVYEEEELLLQYFELVRTDDEIDARTIYLTTTQLIAELQKVSGLHNLSKKRLGEVLHTGLKCMQKQKPNESGTRIQKWCLRRLNTLDATNETDFYKPPPKPRTERPPHPLEVKKTTYLDLPIAEPSINF